MRDVHVLGRRLARLGSVRCHENVRSRIQPPPPPPPRVVGMQVQRVSHSTGPTSSGAFVIDDHKSDRLIGLLMLSCSTPHVAKQPRRQTESNSNWQAVF